jgi:GT2 family glycosyltransferase
MKISVVIPNWNGEGLIKKNLAKVISALPKGTEVIVVDDGSTDGSLNLLKRLQINLNFKLIVNSRNLGFLKTCNKVVKKTKGDYFLLLNTDVIPKKGFLKPTLKHFKDKRVFAVSFNESKYGWAKIWWRGGFIHIGDGGQDKKAHISGWASGGSAIFRKSIWKKLGGFDPIFHPFYWEDFDIGFRAWTNGYKIIWEPNALVEHKHEASISKLSRQYVNLIKERNQLLFIWKNISNPLWRVSNLFGIILRVFMGPNYIKVVVAALNQYYRFGRPKIKKTITARKVINFFR